MVVTKTSDYSGETSTRELPISDDQILLYREGIKNISQVFPDLSASDREFIKSGMTDAEWEEMAGMED